MNKTQRHLLVVLIPIIVLITTLWITSNISIGWGTSYARPFLLEKTGWVWLLAVMVITGFEYWVFKDNQ